MTTAVSEHAPEAPTPEAHINPRWRRWLRAGIVALVGLYTVVMLAGGAFVLLARVNVGWVEFGKSGYLLGLWSVIPALMVALLLRNRWLIGGMLPLIALITVYYAPYLLPKAAATVPPDTPTITVMTFNLFSPRDGADGFARIMRESGADVVAVQELSDFIAESLAESLADAYPHQALHPQDGHGNYFRGQGIFSRFPIIEDDYWQFDEIPIDMTHGHQRVVVDVDGREVVVYNTHAWPPLDWKGGLAFTRTTWEDDAHQLSISLLLERVQPDIDAQRPVIVVGDFNFSDQFIEYAQMTAIFTDAFRAAGQGMGFTYPSRGFGPIPPLIRLDYVFHNAVLETLAAQIWSESGASDHLPVLATLTLNQPD